MFKRPRKPDSLGKAGLTVAILALVMAMVGGAYAAGGLTKSQEKQVTKIAKKYAGKPGAAGANGTNGAPGPAGPAGTNGKDGTSVTGENIAAGGACGAGVTGVKYTSASGTNNVCNGAKGAPGAQGEPGETGFTKTLPSGETETGTWAFGPVTGGGTAARVPISFNIPLAEPLDSEHAIFAGEGGNGSGNGCPGSNEAPSAEPGFLCVYLRNSENIAVEGTPLLIPPTKALSTAFGADVQGAVLFVTGEEGLPTTGFGTFAVTAP